MLIPSCQIQTTSVSRDRDDIEQVHLCELHMVNLPAQYFIIKVEAIPSQPFLNDSFGHFVIHVDGRY